MINTKAADRFAKALFSIAEESNSLDTVFSDMNDIKNTVASSKELENLTLTPVVSFDKKQAIFNEIFKDSVSKLTLDFILLIIKKGRDSIILAVVDGFIQLYNKKQNRMPVTVTTAVEMEDGTKNKVLERISSQTGKTILPDFVVDESIKGGIKVQIEDWVYDASIETELKEIHAKLIKGEN